MKFKWDKKYLYWGVTAFVTLALVVLFSFLLNNNEDIKKAFISLWKISSPIIDGAVIAFLINPLMKWFEKSVFSIFDKKIIDFRLLPRWKKTLVRTFSISLSYLVLLIFAASFVIAVAPQLKESILNITTLFPTYKDNFLNWINETAAKHPEISKNFSSLITENEAYIDNWSTEVLMPKLQDFASKFAGNAGVYVFNFLSGLWNVVIGFVVSIYILFKKETFKGQFKKIIYSIFNIKTGNVILKNGRMVNDKFSGFIIGKLVDSFIIGLLCFVGCSILGLEYPVLLALIIGVTNIIPFFGPFIGAVPCVLLLLLINPLHALYFVIFVIILQLLDGNVIGPKILGSSTGISSFWVIFAITIFGGFWGVPGMIIGVPLMAVIYTLVQSALEVNLKNKSLSSCTTDYIYLDHIEDNDDKSFVEKELESVLAAKKKEEKAKLNAEKKKLKEDLKKVHEEAKEKKAAEAKDKETEAQESEVEEDK